MNAALQLLASIILTMVVLLAADCIGTAETSAETGQMTLCGKKP
jgi:hypothetical protein